MGSLRCSSGRCVHRPSCAAFGAAMRGLGHRPKLTALHAQAFCVIAKPKLSSGTYLDRFPLTLFALALRK